MKPNHDVPLKIDEEMDAALRLFREIQPPAVLLSHVHQSLENAVEATEQTSRGWFWIPATGVAMALLLSAIYFQTHWMRGKQSSKIERAKMMADFISPKFTSSQPEFSHEQKISTPEIHHKREHSQHHRAVKFLNYPLTKQEHLLVEFTQNAKPEDLRDLNPEYQAGIEAQQEAEFEAYVNSRNTQDTAGIAETN